MTLFTNRNSRNSWNCPILCFKNKTKISKIWL